MRHLLDQRQTLFFFAIIGVLTLVVMLKVELPLLLGMNAAWERKIDGYRALLHVHALFGCIAMACAPLQFFPEMRRHHLTLHRRLGRCYALSILVSAPIAVYIALAHLSGSEKWAVVLQAILWISTTAAAVHAAMTHQLMLHRVWIARSYALTLTFVLSRLMIDVLGWSAGPDIGGNAGLVLLTTFGMIMLADFLSFLPGQLGRANTRRLAAASVPTQGQHHQAD